MIKWKRKRHKKNLLLQIRITQEDLALTQIANPPVELHSVGQLAGWLVSLHPLARVGGQVALARTSVVEKPAARDVIVVAAERAADGTSCLPYHLHGGQEAARDAADALVPLVRISYTTNFVAGCVTI